MKREVATLLSIVTIVMSCLAGCGGPAGDAKKESTPKKKSTPKAVIAAYEALHEGKVNELRAMLAKKPSIANTLYGQDSLLNLVIDTRPEYPRMHASIKVLLESGADPNLNAPQLLLKSIWRREPEIFQLLLDYGADPTVVWKKRNINMLEYSRSYGDKRFDKITDAWEKAQAAAN